MKKSDRGTWVCFETKKYCENMYEALNSNLNYAVKTGKIEVFDDNLEKVEYERYFLWRSKMSRTVYIKINSMCFFKRYCLYHIGKEWFTPNDDDVYITDKVKFIGWSYGGWKDLTLLMQERMEKAKKELKEIENITNNIILTDFYSSR